jgi:hypothetical protein
MKRSESSRAQWLQRKALEIAGKRGISLHEAKMVLARDMLDAQARKKKRVQTQVESAYRKLYPGEERQKRRAAKKKRKSKSLKLEERDARKSGQRRITSLKEEERRQRADRMVLVKIAEAAQQRGVEKKEAALAKLRKKAVESENRHQFSQSPLSGGEITVHQLPFWILPAGQWTSDDIVEHYKTFQESGSKTAWEIQWQRIRDIQKLKPVKVWVGEETWNGYVVYEFPDTENVILECPVEGNAVYVLKGNVWKDLIRLSKGEIRGEHQGSYRKVVHRGDWLARTRRALYQL